MRRTITFLLLFALPVAAMADGIAITGAHLHTLSDSGSIENGSILVRDGRIEAVGADLAIPDDYEIVEAAGKVITPGLIESYSQLALVEIRLEPTAVDSLVTEYPLGAAFDVRYALNPASVALAVNRRDGVTRAVVAPGPGNDPFAGLGAVIRLGGDPLLVRSGAALFAAIGAGSAAFVGGSRSAVIQRLHRGFRLAAAYRPDRYRPGPGDFSHQDLAALKAYLAGDAPLAIQVDRANEIRQSLALAHAYRRRLVLLGGAEAWKLADELAASDAAVVADVLDNLPSSYDRLGARIDNIVRLAEAGVTVLLTSGESQNARNIRQAAGNAVARGLPWQTALAAMTREPARVWGLEAGAGTLSKGAPADLVVWTGDPLEITEWAETVMIDGVWQDMSSRQTRLFERYRDLDEVDGEAEIFYR